MNIKFYNTPEPAKLDPNILPEMPEFVTYKPDTGMARKLQAQYERFENVLIIAHGGSVTSFYGMQVALNYQLTKKVFFLSTTDPDYIFELKKTLTPENTLVIAISKSGETVTQVEALIQFANFPLLIITGKTGTLRAIGEKLNANIITHPVIGGRYTGLTEVALVPAAICGLDVEGLFHGASHLYKQYGQQNLAWQAASVFYELEQSGFVDVFMPFYAHNLFPMSNVIVQLCHESFGKEGKGQTYFAHEAPESQHHTNQRFFGGTKNICAIFTVTDSFIHPTTNNYPASLHSIQIKGHPLFDINKIPLEKAMDFEAEGTMEDARIHGIPFAKLSMAGFLPEEIGTLIAFWQLYAVYSSVLRQVNPFDQPQVENSKNLSFNKRLEFKGLL